MITEKEAIKLLKKYNINDLILNHCIGVSKIAYDLAIKVLNNNPELDINPEKVKIAWLLHDIWKSYEWIHELNTIKILKNEWLNEVAKISMHWFIYEYYLEKGNNNVNKYLPKTIENKLLILSDMYYNKNQERVSIDERFNDILNRYSNDLQFCWIVKLAKNRILILEKEILWLI